MDIQNFFGGMVNPWNAKSRPSGRGKVFARGAAVRESFPIKPEPDTREARAETNHGAAANTGETESEDGTVCTVWGSNASGESNAEAAAVAAAAAAIGAIRGQSALVKDFARVENVALAFGLRKDRPGEGHSFEEDGSYLCGSSAHTQYSVSTGGGSSVGRRGGTDERHDLREASRAIANPLFGDATRAVGRQPKKRGAP